MNYDKYGKRYRLNEEQSHSEKMLQIIDAGLYELYLQIEDAIAEKWKDELEQRKKTVKLKNDSF
jgi:hypothetical protein